MQAFFELQLAIRGVRRDDKMPFSDIGHVEEIAMWNELPFGNKGNMLTVHFYRSSEQKQKKEPPERTVVFFKHIVCDLTNDLNRLAFGILRDPTKPWKTEHGMYNTYNYKTHIFTAEELEALDAGDSI